MEFACKLMPSRARTEDNMETEWVKDGSVDLKGSPVSYSATGGWNAAFYIMAVEIGGKLTYFTIAASLFTYLTNVMHQGVATSAEMVNIWSGLTTVLPLMGGFLSDAYLGRYWMILCSFLVYLLGLALLMVSVSLSSLRPRPFPSCLQTSIKNKPCPTTFGQSAVLFAALYLISCGLGGMNPSLQSFAANQFDYQHPKENKQKTCFFNWYYFGACLGVLMSNTVIVYVQGNVSWGAGFGIVASVSLVSILVFSAGTPTYRHRLPAGSPLTRISQVLVAAFRNRNLRLPSDRSVLYKAGLCPNHTNDFKCLDKAAVPDEEKEERTINSETNPWKVCAVSQVEEAKQIARMVPVWVTTLMYSLALAQGGTFFVKQSSTMDRRLGTHFQIPPASILAIVIITTLIAVAVYDRVLVPVAKRFTGSQRGISILQRIGVGMLIAIVGMIIAALIEVKRLNTAKTHGLLDNPQAVVPMSVFWLCVPNVLLGISDAFTLVGLQEFFYGEMPDTMRSLGVACSLAVTGVGSFLSSLLINIVDRVTAATGDRWLVDNLNRSRLDKLYWLIVILNAINLVVFIYVAHKYKYTRSQDDSTVALATATVTVPAANTSGRARV